MCLFDNILIYSWSARYTDGGKKGENRYVDKKKTTQEYNTQKENVYTNEHTKRQMQRDKL